MLDVLGLLKVNDLNGRDGETVMYRAQAGTIVEKLLCGVTRHLAEPFRFTLLTDRVTSPQHVLLPSKLGPGSANIYREVALDGSRCHGWWCKLQIFREDLMLGQRALYIDLDNVVVGDLAPLFNPRLPPVVMADDVHIPRLPNGSIIAFDPLRTRMLWEEYKLTPGRIEELYSVWPNASDQAYISGAMKRAGAPVQLVQDLFGQRSVVHIEDELLHGVEPDDTTMFLMGRWKAKPWLVDHPVIDREWRC